MTTPLLLSLLALLVGPLLYSTARVRSALAAIDAFALVAVGGLVLFDVLPQSYAVVGWWVIPAALIGLLAVGWACTSHIGKGHGLGKIGIPLVVVAIALHALFDGVGLASGDFQAGGGSLPLAVVLHRIPVGLGVWWLARPLWGMRSAVGILMTIVVMTLVGFHSGEAVLPGASEH